METNCSEHYLVTFYSSSFTDRLQGVDIIGEKHFVLAKEEKSSFKWEEYGFKLQVPKVQPSRRVRPVRCEVKVSLSGQFDLPENSELVNAVPLGVQPSLVS